MDEGFFYIPTKREFQVNSIKYYRLIHSKFDKVLQFDIFPGKPWRYKWTQFAEENSIKTYEASLPTPSHKQSRNNCGVSTLKAVRLSGGRRRSLSVYKNNGDFHLNSIAQPKKLISEIFSHEQQTFQYHNGKNKTKKTSFFV